MSALSNVVQVIVEEITRAPLGSKVNVAEEMIAEWNQLIKPERVSIRMTQALLSFAREFPG